MMGSDARDVLGLPSTGPAKPTPAKVQKPKGRGPTGMIREVLDLKYEGAPPISIVAPKFKEKPKLPFKPRLWEETAFGNSARKDGLILRHWRRKGDVTNAATLPVTPADSNAASEMEQDEKAAPTIPDSYWAKYNVKVERPRYTDEQYESLLKSDDWSKEETDYLVNLAVDFDLRWIVIADRYEYQPKEMPKESEDSMALTVQAKPRTQEDMKARYYDVASKAMVLHNPLSSMSTSEFDAHEKMTKYNSVKETQRKKYAEQLMARTDEEKIEEEFLLKELSRIVHNQEKLSNERNALYDRLEPAQTLSRDPHGSHSTAMYQSSQGLTQLMQNLLTQSKNKELEKKEKRRSAMGVGEGDVPAGQNADGSQRHSLGGGQDKRGSIGSAGSRQLSAREEQKYGVSHPNERLTGGVQFRHERVAKAGIAKSGVQTSRIGAALTELKIPPRLVMPTAAVVAEYEKLIESIKTLLEVRKLTEKLDGEIKVWRAQKELQEAKARGEEVKEEEPSPGNGNEDEAEDEANVVDTQAESRRKAEAEAEDDEDEDEKDEDEKDADEKDEDEKDDDEKEEEEVVEENGEQKEESDEDANHEESSEDGDDVDAEENVVDAQSVEDEDVEMQNGRDHLEHDDDGVNEDNEDDDDDASLRASASPTSRGENLRKRSASVMSHVSNKSSKRQRTGGR